MSISRPALETPAHATPMVGALHARDTLAIHRSPAPESVTSTRSTRPRSPIMGSALASDHATLAPRVESCATMAAPIEPAPPVITATSLDQSVMLLTPAALPCLD